MKLVVVHEDGNTEAISIGGACQMIEGARLNRIREASGAEYYFTQTGFYDGWGNAPASPRQEMNSTDSSGGVPGGGADELEQSET